MTAPEFAAEHGDPADWTPDEVETWQHLAEADRADTEPTTPAA